MRSTEPFHFDESGAPVLDFSTTSDGAHWCTVHAYGLSNTIGPFEQLDKCKYEAGRQVELQLRMARLKVERGDLIIKLW